MKTEWNFSARTVKQSQWWGAGDKSELLYLWPSSMALWRLKEENFIQRLYISWIREVFLLINMVVKCGWNAGHHMNCNMLIPWQHLLTLMSKHQGLLMWSPKPTNKVIIRLGRILTCWYLKTQIFREKISNFCILYFFLQILKDIKMQLC